MTRELPRFALAIALLFWGQQTGLWILALPSAALVELASFVRKRDLTEAEFARVSYLCTVGLIVIAVYAYVTRPLGMAGMTAISLFPAACLPMVLVQRISIRRGVPLRSLVPILSKLLKSEKLNRDVDVAYTFFALCIFAASAANSATIWFYVGMLVLTAWTLWRYKPVTTKVAAWVPLLGVAAIVGYIGQIGLHSLQAKVEGRFASLIPGSGPGVASSVRNTAIGSIGTLKLSGRIVLRMQPESGAPPQLLHTATFNTYSGSQWMAAARALKPIAASTNGTARAKLAMRFSDMPAWLPLPDQTTRIDGPEGLVLRRDRYGDVQVDEGPALAMYKVSFGGESSADTLPEPADTFVPPALRPLFARVAEQLQLASMSEQDRLRAVASYFQNNFSYSLYQPPPESEHADPLELFMSKTHAGHCEYFATGTVLLLRAAGIPARYSIGYSAQEWNPRENAYVIRDRHAHAWARVYANGNWQDLDTTPASWANIEAARASRWQGAEDYFSQLSYRFLQWRAEHAGGWIGSIAMWLLLPALIFAIWSLRSVWKKRAVAANALRATSPSEGADSDFYRIERTLEKAGFGRRTSESMKVWIQRLESTAREEIMIETLQPLLLLHYRYRFDPHGLRVQDRARLKFLTDAWLTQHAKAKKKT